jgi:ribonuclease Z
MARVIFLGTASALPSATQDNTSLLFESNGHYLMIDCSGTPYRKLLALDIPTEKLDHVLITHHHIDHCYGLPSLIECLWIQGREVPLHIYALKSALEVIGPLLDLWHLRDRSFRSFPIVLHPISGRENELVFDDGNFTVHTTPTVHAVPSVATKVTFPSNTNFVYSSDTAPCKELIHFAKGADNFLLECTFCTEDIELSELSRHTHSLEFSEMAAQVKAKHTLLIHHSDVTSCPHTRILSEIKETGNYPAKVTIPRELDQLVLD